MATGIALTDLANVDIAEIARKAEAAGFDSIWAPEHLAYPVREEDGVIPDGTYPGMATMLDPFVVLSAMAAATVRIKLGTGVCLVPQRHPLLTAKLVSSLDTISKGRFLFGIGAGWLEPESRMFGGDFSRRWSQTSDYIKAMKVWWASPHSSYQGSFVNYDEVWRYPEPAQKPHPPILIAGVQEKVTERIVAYGDGWIPMAGRIDPNELETARKAIEAALDAAGRDISSFSVTVYGAKPDREQSQTYLDAGADRVVHFVQGSDTEGTLKSLDRLAEMIP